MMLTRKLFNRIVRARGLSPDKIVARTGIPSESLNALLNSGGSDGKDPQKLISARTFERVLDILGLNAGGNGLSQKSIIAWECPENRRDKAQWQDAITGIRKECLGETIRVAELVASAGPFSRKRFVLLVHDVDSGYRIGISGLHGATRTFVLKALGVAEVDQRRAMTSKELDMHAKLLSNGAYRQAYFAEIMGAKKYDWSDVRAAAKEFNYTPEALIDLIVEAAVGRDAALVEPPALNDQVMFRVV